MSSIIAFALLTERSDLTLNIVGRSSYFLSFVGSAGIGVPSYLLGSVAK